MAERKKFLIYPWNVSITNDWTPEGLHGLRDEQPETLAEILSGGDLEMVYVSVIAEYFSHGYVRKAAEVTRLLAEKHPSLKEFVNKNFDTLTARELLKIKLDDLPASPEEFPRNRDLEYLQ